FPPVDVAKGWLRRNLTQTLVLSGRGHDCSCLLAPADRSIDPVPRGCRALSKPGDRVGDRSPSQNTRNSEVAPIFFDRCRPVELSRRDRKRLLLLAKDDAAGNDQRNLSATAGSARDRELRADTGGAFAHALQPEMPFFSSTRRGCVHAAAVIGDANGQLLRVGESHLDATPSGMRAGVANRLIGDSIDVVTNDGMYFSGLARY